MDGGADWHTWASMVTVLPRPQHFAHTLCVPYYVPVFTTKWMLSRGSHLIC